VVPIALLVVATLVVVATGLGLMLRKQTGRARRVEGAALDASRFGAPGDRATLLQLSTPLCAQCRPTARLLQAAAAERAGVAHLEIDLTAHPALADELAVRQTPTTLLLDASGRIRSRIGGRPQPALLARELDLLLETP
jgi:thiol-disulfide isomerase/thioredoxin